MGETLNHTTSILFDILKPDDCFPDVNILDSIPIITCSSNMHGKVAKEITDKTFCSTKGIWYYGLKFTYLVDSLLLLLDLYFNF
jgi:hypothetical protein